MEKQSEGLDGEKTKSAPAKKFLGIEKEVMFSTKGHPVGDWSELALIL